MQGSSVVLACRSVPKANEARRAILEAIKAHQGHRSSNNNTTTSSSSSSSSSDKKVIVLPLDLCNFKSVRAFVTSFRALKMPLHCLINNAGVMFDTRQECEPMPGRKMEVVMVSNHFSHFLLTNLLLPDLHKTNGRVVVLSSALHKSVAIDPGFDFDNVHSEKSYSLFATYSQAKLANCMFAIELQRRLSEAGSRITVNVVHPGCVRTEVTRNMPFFMRWGDWLASPMMKWLQKTGPEGAYCTVFAATAKEMAGIGGKYLFHCQLESFSQAAQDEKKNRKLWELSSALTDLEKEE
jgi:NAD(P)-dependent dehydrogenase (short-subunit alcohol dehydrogenase family)